MQYLHNDTRKILYFVVCISNKFVHSYLHKIASKYKHWFRGDVPYSLSLNNFSCANHRNCLGQPCIVNEPHERHKDHHTYIQWKWKPELDNYWHWDKIQKVFEDKTFDLSFSLAFAINIIMCIKHTKNLQNYNVIF